MLSSSVQRSPTFTIPRMDRATPQTGLQSHMSVDVGEQSHSISGRFGLLSHRTCHRSGFPHRCKDPLTILNAFTSPLDPPPPSHAKIASPGSESKDVLVLFNTLQQPSHLK